MIRLLLIIPCIATSEFLGAQCKNWDWPEEQGLVHEEFALFQDAYQNKHYSQARAPLKWLLQNTPKLNVAIYVRGVEVYERLADHETDPARKNQLVDSVLLLYDMRMTQCGESATVTNRKALAAFKYLVKGPEPQKVLALMDKAFELNGVEIFNATLLPYMQTVVVCQSAQKNLSEEDILGRYDRISEIIAAKVKQSAKDSLQIEKLEKIQSDIDQWLLKVVKVDCEFVHQYLAPRFKAAPDDLTMAKRILAYLLKNKCTEDQLWVEAAEVIYKNENDFGLAKNIAIQYALQKNNNMAEHYLEEALRTAPAAKDSAEVYLIKGEWSTHLGNRSAAQAWYRRAITLNPVSPDGYEKLGDLYYNSFEECAQHKVMADDRAVYLIAFDYYQKAGNRHKMEIAQKSFPSTEEIFLINYSKGQKVRVGCYINEVTSVRTRD